MPNWDRQTYEDFLARRAKNNTPVALSTTEPKQDQEAALDSAVSREAKSIRRAIVRFVFYRTHLLDRDSAYASTKDLLDGLRHAALISDDSEDEIDLQVEQFEVTSRAHQKTLIEITQ